MDPLKLRAYRSAIQWLDSDLTNCRENAGYPHNYFQIGGWIRGVGSCTPYFHGRSRAAMSRAEVDATLADLKIHELPAARGCTYIVPDIHFAEAIALAQFPGDEPKMESAERKLGFTWEQINGLKTAVVDALKSGPADPAQLKSALGDRVVSYGDAGKKVGISTDLPAALTRLQKEGVIRRIPTNGRLDNERYAYALWPENPLDGFELTKPQLQARLAFLYAYWIGPVTLAEFQWFSGFSKSAALAALDSELVTRLDDDYWLTTYGLDKFIDFAPEAGSNPQFLTCLDNMILLTRNLGLHIDEADRPLVAQIEGRELPKGSLFDLDNHPIFDRGRLVGLWAFDQPNRELVYTAWGGDKDLIAQRARETEEFVKSDLGDARSFSMDSPKSRQARINLLRAQPDHHG